MNIIQYYCNYSHRYSPVVTCQMWTKPFEIGWVWQNIKLSSPELWIVSIKSSGSWKWCVTFSLQIIPLCLKNFLFWTTNKLPFCYYNVVMTKFNYLNEKCRQLATAGFVFMNLINFVQSFNILLIWAWLIVFYFRVITAQLWPECRMHIWEAKQKMGF